MSITTKGDFSIVELELRTSPSTSVHPVKATDRSGDEVREITGSLGGNGTSGSVECVGEVGGRIGEIVWGQLTSMTPSTPVQPLKATVGSGDTSSMLLRVGRGGGNWGATYIHETIHSSATT